MGKNKHIIIVNFDFPPNDGIGGRRWAKFAKQLASIGYKVHIIKADPIPGLNTSPWSDDVIHENIITHSLPRNYPTKFSHPKNDFLSRVQYQFLKQKLLFQEKGTIYDISIGWRNGLIKKATELIQTYEITNVIASGAPWKMLYDVASLKDTFGHLNIIIDYRDPWLNALNYGMPSLSEVRKKNEADKQSYILERAAAVITPYEYLTDELHNWSKINNRHQPIFKTITHFYDPRDIIKNETISTENVMCLYGGDLYQGIKPQLLLLKRELQKIADNHSNLHQHIFFRFYTNTPDTQFFEGLDNAKMLPSIGKGIFKEMAKATCFLILLPDNKRNDRTTKFYESLPYGKPFIILAEEGEVSQFVKKNALGYVLNSKEGNLEEILRSMILDVENHRTSFEYTAYSLPVVTKTLTALFT